MVDGRLLVDPPRVQTPVRSVRPLPLLKPIIQDLQLGQDLPFLLAQPVLDHHRRLALPKTAPPDAPA